MKIPARLVLLISDQKFPVENGFAKLSYFFLLTSEFPWTRPSSFYFLTSIVAAFHATLKWIFGFKSGQDTNMAAQKINTVGFLSEFERETQVAPRPPILLGPWLWCFLPTNQILKRAS